MEILILVITLLILAETSALIVKNRKQIFGTSQKRKIYVDTSALIDGRILAVAQTGFIGDDLIIPRSVIREMQILADGKDPHKRNRARAGLDNVNSLERVEFCNVEILQDELDRTPVDDRLIALAKANHGAICTTDYNLQKVAITEKIDVLNVNELALALKDEVNPGERMKLKIIGTGNNAGQGVAYTEEGVMVIVDNAAKKVGKEVEVEFLRSLQSPAGRMFFAKIVNPRRKTTTRKKK